MRSTESFLDMRRGDLRALGLLGALAGALFVLPWLAGRTYFWGDLTYIHHPWRALAAEMLQRGSLPLWNPYAYLGMPLAAQMQSAVWYPGTLPFHLLPFSSAVALYDAAHFWLAGALAFLWLRRLGLRRFPAFGGAAVYMLGGSMSSRIPFLNHVSTLAFFPALLLAAGSPALAALSAALGFFSGYPSMLGGELAAAWALTALLDFRTRPRWLAAGAVAAALSAALLLPAARLTLESKRSAGIEEEESLRWSYAPSDLIQFTAPPLVRALGRAPEPGEPPAYCPTLSWWKTSYLGLGGLAASAWGLVALPPALLARTAAYLGAALLLLLGGTNPASRWLWTRFAPLRYVRYPGNMAYLALPVFAWLAARGLERIRPRRTAAFAALALAGELFLYSWGAQPRIPSSYFTDAGPLVSALRRELGGHRYIPSPLALKSHRGFGSDEDSAALDLKHRLYGLTNMPYHLASVGNFGEPLVPAASYAFMDFLYRLPGPGALAPWLGWADAALLFTRDPMPAPTMTYLGDSLWHLYRAPGPAARAFWLSAEEGAALPAGLPARAPDLSRAVPLEEIRPREDRLSVRGSFARPGWIFLSEPRASGWRAALGGQPAAPLPALAAFQKFPVPAGAWDLRLRYDPLPWRAGRALTLAALCAMAAYWYNRLRRKLAR